MLKSRTLLIVVSLALLLALFASRSNAPATPALAAGSECDNSRTVQVSGSAVIRVVPDLVTIQLGVTSNDTTPQGVYDKNTAAMKKVMAAIRALGVADKDISTDYYLIHPVYEDYSSLDIKGYRIDNTIVVNLKDVSKVSQVLAAALSAGANEVVDVQFKTTQLRQYRDQARDLAMKAAQEKARDLARAANAQARLRTHHRRKQLVILWQSVERALSAAGAERDAERGEQRPAAERRRADQSGADRGAGRGAGGV